MILEHTNLSLNQIKTISYLTAIIIWLPSATLFANGSRITVLKIYDSIAQKQLKFSYISLIIFVIALASGSAYAQMALEFFNTSKFIPGIFKEISKHYNFVFYGIMPLAFIISAVVNAYALENLRKETMTHNRGLFPQRR